MTVLAQSRDKAVTAPAALRRVYSNLSRARRRQFWIVLVVSVLGGLAELVTIGTIFPFLAHLTVPTEGGKIVTATLIFLAAATAAGLLRLGLAWATQSFVQNAGHDLSTDIQRRILAQPYAYHVAHNSSEVVASLELVHQLTYGVIQPLLQAAAGIVIGLFLVVAIAAVNLPIALVAAAGFAATYAVIALLFYRPLDRRSGIIADAYGDRVRLVQESTGGIRDIIIDQAQDAHIEAFRAVDKRLTQARTEATMAGLAPRYVVETAGLIILAIIALWLGRSAGGLASALPTIGALALGAQRLLPIVHQLYQGWSLAVANRAIAAKVVGLLDLAAPTVPETEPQELDREIGVREVTFTYSGRREPALADVSFTVPVGTSLALTGPTGSGKSTLADVLMGLLTPSSGAVTVDGQPLDPRAWRRSIAHVPQSIFLIDASIARNIALGVANAPIDPDRVAAAARAAELTSFLQTLPEGADTIVGERGVRLSGGQRQRIGIARALYKQAKVLFLDEATSALDEVTEARVMANLAAMPGVTMVVIAHRTSTVGRCDRLLRLERGRLVDVRLP